MDNVGWGIALLVPMNEVTGSGDVIRIFILILVIVFIVIAALLAFILANRLTKRIRLLAEVMKNVEHGNYGQPVAVDGNDEISLLQLRFNKMTGEIHSLVEEVYRSQLSKKSAELRVLEGQINSHFLYNTLETIRWMAFALQAHDIVKVVEALAKFFRISLNKGKEIISVEQELEHIRAYLDIQNMRFKGRIRYSIEASTEVLNCRMIKLLLQPLVENAIVHGIQGRPDKSGHIAIAVKQDQDKLVLTVSDDGVGMRQEEADDVLVSEDKGYGLRNIVQRVKLYYGDCCGIRIVSAPGAGMLVELTVADHIEPQQGG